jgi:hypothetical protein
LWCTLIYTEYDKKIKPAYNMADMNKTAATAELGTVMEN